MSHDDPPIKVTFARREPGVEMNVGTRREWTVLAVIVLLVIVAVAALAWAERDPQPAYTRPAAPTPAPIAGALAWGLAVVLGAIALYVVGWVIVSLLRHWTAYQAEKRRARQVPAEPNGLYPLVEGRDGRLHNPNAAPAGVVDLGSRQRPSRMPDPETPAAAEAAARASFVQAASAAGAAALNALAGARRPPAAEPVMPPLVVSPDPADLPAEHGHLIEAAREDYRLLEERHG